MEEENTRDDEYPCGVADRAVALQLAIQLKPATVEILISDAALIEAYLLGEEKS